MTFKTRYICLVGAAAIMVIVAATALRSEEGDGSIGRDRIPAAARKEIKAVELEIDRIEAESLDKAQSATLDRFQQITLLGKLIFYDQQLSVNRNQSCSFCHMPEASVSKGIHRRVHRAGQRSEPDHSRLPGLCSDQKPSGDCSFTAKRCITRVPISTHCRFPKTRPARYTQSTARAASTRTLSRLK